MSRAILFAAGLALSATAASADQGFLFDLLRQKPYRAAWDALMKGVQPTPDWLTQFNRNYDGVAGAVTEATVDGQVFEVSYVCKPEDCAGHRFVVAFEASPAPHAFGALGGKDNSPAYFGAPPASLQDLMVKALSR
jgi:hypothetical protein